MSVESEFDVFVATHVNDSLFWVAVDAGSALLPSLDSFLSGMLMLPLTMTLCTGGRFRGGFFGVSYKVIRKKTV